MILRQIFLVVRWSLWGRRSRSVQCQYVMSSLKSFSATKSMIEDSSSSLSSLNDVINDSEIELLRSIHWQGNVNPRDLTIMNSSDAINMSDRMLPFSRLHDRKKYSSTFGRNFISLSHDLTGQSSWKNSKALVSSDCHVLLLKFKDRNMSRIKVRASLSLFRDDNDYALVRTTNVTTLTWYFLLFSTCVFWIMCNSMKEF